MKTLRISIVLVALLCGSLATDVAGQMTYFCKATISTKGDGGPSSLSGQFVYDLGTVGSCSNWQYNTNFQAACQTPANTACSNKASSDPNFNSAAFWCAMGVPNGSTIRAYAAVGPPRKPASIDKGDYIAAQTKGVLTNKPAVTKLNCPIGWMNHNNVDGGVTPDGRCKKMACQAINIFPLPPNGTQLGTWGFTWGNALYAYGSSANGGGAISSVVSPAVCSW